MEANPRISNLTRNRIQESVKVALEIAKETNLEDIIDLGLSAEANENIRVAIFEVTLVTLLKRNG